MNRGIRSACRLIAGLLVFVDATASAQAPPAGSCVQGKASVVFTAGQTKARLVTLQSLFYIREPFLHIPADPPIEAMYAHAVWLGGLVGGEIRIAVDQYGTSEFFPGPLDRDGNPQVDCTAHDRIFVISADDIGRYEETGIASADLSEWPFRIGAEVVDGDGVPGNYDLAAGDRPRIVGDQTAFWVMNDRGGTHRYSGTDPIGLEARITAFGFDVRSPAWSESSAFRSPIMTKAVTHTLFFRYILTYRGDRPFEDARIGFWWDSNLGELWSNDYVGADTTLQLAYSYDRDDRDTVFEGRPAAVGTLLLQGPARRLPSGGTDTLGMTNFMEIRDLDDGPWPNTPQAWYLMQSQWGRYGGQPVTYGSTGHDDPGTPTPIMYPGDPVTGSYWSMENVDGVGTPYWGSIMRPLMASGPFRMEPGDTQEIIFAIVWQQGKDRLDSISRLRGAAQVLHATYKDLMALEPDTSPPSVPVPVPERTAVRSVSPNPASESATLVVDLAREERVAIELYDLLGRRVLQLDNRLLPAGEHTLTLPVGSLRSGIYVWWVGVRAAWASGSLVVVH